MFLLTSMTLSITGNTLMEKFMEEVLKNLTDSLFSPTTSLKFNLTNKTPKELMK